MISLLTIFNVFPVFIMIKPILITCFVSFLSQVCLSQAETEGYDLPIFIGAGVQMGTTYLKSNLELNLEPKPSIGFTFNADYKYSRNIWMFTDFALTHNSFGAITPARESVNLRFLGTILRYGLSYEFGPGKRIKIGPMIQLGIKINLNPFKDYTICSKDGTCIESRDIYGGFGEVCPGLRLGYRYGRVLLSILGSVSALGKTDISGNKYSNRYAHLAATYYWVGPNDGGKKSTKQYQW